ncbi:hypothetical protein BVC80_8995g10 [Macleaya cordata]|uniref:RNase H type-1 domain-containing protein n=1 Tax=Macleaya cordata TaxID=56857 RepID=A0A200Q531_MACCD|nr:hypothetical protein BVC80_8995g10 [Macleaya cordata]
MSWYPPPFGLYYLNVDGARSEDGFCAGGGVIRDATGVLVATFSHFYVEGPVPLAETKALLLDELRLCRDDLGIQTVTTQ